MAANGGGWLSGLGRLFTGQQSNNNDSRNDQEQPEGSLAGKKNEAISSDIGSPNGSATNGARNIRYLSPSVLDAQKHNGVQSTPSNDIFSNFGARKRQLESTSPRSFVQDEIISQGRAKRFRSMGGNFSLLEEPVRMGSERLDATWAAGPSFKDGSPSSSIRSLRSRISDNTSVSSNGLSSKTRAILQQLEKVCTPAKETRHLPLMKPLDGIKEKWAPLNSSNAPPLRKSGSTVPSRIQLISSTAGVNQRKPYWRDILRKPKSSEIDLNSSQVLSLPGDADGSVIHPLFDVGSPVKSIQQEGNLNVKQSAVIPVLKGSDGRNVFNTKDLDEEINCTPAPLASLPIPVRDVPKSGFIDDVVFSFAAPSVATIENNEKEDTDESCGEESSNGSILSDSGDSESSDDETRERISDDNKVSRPPTSADTDSSTVRSGSPPSSKSSPITDTSSAAWSCPDCFVSNTGSKCECCGHINGAADKSAASAPWSCPDCFVSNTGPKCECCGHVNNAAGKSAGVQAQKTLVSNLHSFAPKTNGGFTFGFGTTKSSEASISTDTTKRDEIATTKPTKLANGNHEEQKSGGTVSSLTAKDGTAKVDSSIASWTCPECFVSNTTYKCACCQYVNKDVAPPSGASESVFGDRAFKPAATGSFAFGISNTSSKPPAKEESSAAATTGLVSTSKDAAGFAANIFGASVKAPLFGIEQKSPEKPAFGVQSTSVPLSLQKKPPLFGTGSTLFSKPGDSIISFGNTADTKTVGASEAVKPAVSIFDSSKPLFGSTSLTTSVGFGQKDAKPISDEVAPNTGFIFGSSANGASKPSLIGFGSAPALPLFGSSALGKDISTTAAAVSASSTIPTTTSKVPLFGTVPLANSVFGSATTSNVSMFGSSLPTSAAAPSTSIFGSVPSTTASAVSSTQFGSTAAPAPLFGSDTTSKPAFSLGGPKPAQNLFSAASSTGSSLFGAPKSDDAPPAKMAAFGNTGTSSSGSLFGNSSGFGGATSSVGFGSFSGAVPPSLPSSSSANSLFSSSVPSNSAFNFGSTEAPSSFNFGGAPAADVSSVFGSTPQPTAAPGAFAFGANPAPPAPGGAFAFNASASTGPSSNARKLVAARRRLPQRK